MRSKYVILMGDFYAKLDYDMIQSLSQSGKFLKQIIIDFNLIVANKMNICQGWWTRVNNRDPNEKSIIDYVLASEVVKPCFSRFLIDESKKFCAYKTNKSQLVYSDHNAFLFDVAIKVNKDKKTSKCVSQWKFTVEGLAKFKLLTMRTNVFDPCHISNKRK